MKKRVILLLVFLGVSCVASQKVQANDDFQYWSRYWADVGKMDKFSLGMYAEVRQQNDAKDTKLYLFSPKLKYALHKNLDLGLAYTYMQYRKNNTVASRSEYFFQHRCELEFNPKYTFENGIKVLSRNRIEFRWIEDAGSDNNRYRSMLQFEFPLDSVDFIKSVYINNEVFYTQSLHELTEHRTVPLGFNIPINDTFSTKLFYLIQSTHSSSSDQWTSDHVLGTQLNIKF
ncbi:MAG: DUF2490 domain-containing protein [Candidatus Omnitrophica bacterium]|nr:DUF2490 domain-containing protein [Candidatus Omnitrophota bacterium]